MTTYDEREYEWLRAFLNVVTWMEKEFATAEEAAKMSAEKEEGGVKPGPKDNAQ